MLKLNQAIGSIVCLLFVTSLMPTTLHPAQQNNSDIAVSSCIKKATMASIDKDDVKKKRDEFCYSCGFLTAALFLILQEKAPTDGTDLLEKSFSVLFYSFLGGFLISAFYDSLYTVGETIFSREKDNRENAMKQLRSLPQDVIHRIKDCSIRLLPELHQPSAELSTQKLIKSNQTHIKNNSATCQVNEYLFNEPTLGIARSTINGRYPTHDGKKVVNTQCDLIYYVLAGTGTVEIEGEMFTIEKDDALFLARNRPYWVEGNNLEVLVVSTPEWTVEQYKEI